MFLKVFHLKRFHIFLSGNVLILIPGCGLNTKTNIVSTLVTGLNEPNDVLIAGHELWITDTNNDQIIKFNLVSKVKEIVKIRY